MLDTEQASSDLVDFWIREHFYDVAYLSELRVCIDGIQPWASMWKASGINESKTIVESIEKVPGLNMFVDSPIKTICETSIRLCNPMGSHWRYPADKRPTKESTDQMRLAESHLDEFWANLEEGMITTTGGLSVLAFVEVLTIGPSRTFHRMPPWKANVTLPKPELEAHPFPFAIT